jgi:Sulfotransferase family
VPGLNRPAAASAPAPAAVPGPEGHRFVFVCGLHRSGTSLLFQALRAHPEVSGFTDTGVPEDEGQHLQDVYPPASAFGGPGRFGFDRRAHLTEASPLVTPANRDALFAAWGRYWDLAKPVLLEKSPPNLVRTRFLQALFPESAFIVLTRHPVAVALATRKWNRAPVGRLLRHWVVCHERYAADAPRLRRAIVVRYEDLVARPDEVMGRLWGFLGLAPHAAPVPVREGVNETYFAAWREAGRGPMKGLLRALAVRRLEPAVRRWGYSLTDLSP